MYSWLFATYGRYKSRYVYSIPSNNLTILPGFFVRDSSFGKPSSYRIHRPACLSLGQLHFADDCRPVLQILSYLRILYAQGYGKRLEFPASLSPHHAHDTVSVLSIIRPDEIDDVNL